MGITRSVIVNALRKFESAGVIESRSSGMKGTYIKVLNDLVFEELDKLRDKVMRRRSSAHTEHAGHVEEVTPDEDLTQKQNDENK